MNKETILVIDGHKLETSSSELDTINDVRQVYDTNLQQTFSNISESLKQKSLQEISATKDIKINFSKDERNIHITSGIIFEVKTGKNLEINLFKNKERFFKAISNDQYQFNEKIFGTSIESDDNSIHYFSDGNSTVLSNLVTNKIIKYSSTENINGHYYTKYYEYFEKHNVGIYLLMANFKPISLVCYNYKVPNNKVSFSFEE